MASRHSDVLSPASGRHAAEASRWSPWIRRFAWLGIAAQVVFVAGVLVACRVPKWVSVADLRVCQP
jgi:hypothetical protein